VLIFVLVLVLILVLVLGLRDTYRKHNQEKRIKKGKGKRRG
jgi:hypothetical protein